MGVDKMGFLGKEKGYALIIVLFTIVFITIITAVFMRGALSNVTQEKTVDENNLVVVSAESGVDYYSWELKKVHNPIVLQAEFEELIKDAIERKESPVNYVSIQGKIANDFEKKLNERIKELLTESARVLNTDGYSHKLLEGNIARKVQNGEIIFVFKGKVEGILPQSSKLKQKDKILEFDLSYSIPNLELVNDNPSVKPGEYPPLDESLVKMPSLKVPAKPVSPDGINGIGKQGTVCVSSGNRIEGKKCDTNGISESNYDINKSSIYLNSTLNSWGTISIENTFINIIQNFTSKNIIIEDTEVVVGNDIIANGGNTTLNNTKLKAKNYTNTGQNSIAKFSTVHMDLLGDLKVQRADFDKTTISTKSIFINSSYSKFNKTDLNVTNSYTSGGVVIENSSLDIGGSFTTNGDPLFRVNESNVTIAGDVSATKGSDIENSILKIGGNYTNNHLPLKFSDSDIYVGGKVSATNGTNFEGVNMVVAGDYSSSQLFKLDDDTNLKIGGTLTLGNGGEMEDSLLIAKRITSNTTLKIDDSVVSTDYLKSDIMTMEDSKVCVIDFDVRKLTMDDDSVLYYLNTFKTSNQSSYKESSVKQLAKSDFEKKCRVEIQTNPSVPEESQEFNKKEWKPPVLEKVEY